MSSPSGSTAAAHTAAAWCSTACWNSRPGTTLFATATSLPPGSPGTSHHCAAVPVTRRAWNVQPHTDPGAPPKCSSNSTPVNCIPQIGLLVRNLRRRPRGEILETAALMPFAVTVIVSAALTGHLWTLALIYLIPERVAMFVLAWWFDWLPH